MTAVVTAQVVAVSGGRWQSIDHDRRYRQFTTGRSLVHSTDICMSLGFCDSFGCFSLIKNARPNSWEDGPSVDKNSLRRSSKNCDLQFANRDRQI